MEYKMVKDKTNYWGVANNENIEHKGTFKDCWQFMVDNYGALTLQQCKEQNIRVTRIG